MVTRKSISWFITDQGRKFSFAAITGAGLAFTAAKFLPQTFFLDKYVGFVHNYSDGQRVTLSNELQMVYNKCLDELDIADVHRKLISPFSVFGFDLFHAGSIKSKYGVAIGIPVNFTYASLADISKEDIKVNQKQIDWSSAAGQKLADALLLPENVKRFAICREILMTLNYKLGLDAAYPFVSIFFVYNMSQFMNQKLKLYGAPTIFRAALYTILGTFGLGTYFLLKDMTEVHYEGKVDKQLCGLGPEYIECGIIFYDKILKRNQALRELMGKEGERKYSKLGNENFGIRQPRIALVHRKQFFEQKLKEIRNQEEIKEN